MYRTPRSIPLATLVLLLAMPHAIAQQCVAPPSGLVYWLAGEGDFDDLAGFYNGHTNGVVDFVPGQVGEALAFDSDDDNVVPHVTDAEQMALESTFTWELWARPTATTTACPESQDGNCSGDQQRVAIFPLHGVANDDAGVGLVIGTNAVCVMEHAAFHLPCLLRYETTISDWTHIAVVMENRVPRLYINGQLVRTGLQSLRTHAYASWVTIGNGYSLGHYRGDLDEVSLYNRVLSDAEILGMFNAGSAGKCKPACVVERHDDLFEHAIVDNHSGLASSLPDGMFGATNITPEADSLLFRDDMSDAFVHSIEWHTSAPVSLEGFALSAMHDNDGGDDRAFREMRLFSRPVGGAFEQVYGSAVRVPYAQVGDAFRLQHCVHLRPRLAQEFRAEFVQHGSDSFPGPRVMEFDGIGPDSIFADGFDP